VLQEGIGKEEGDAGAALSVSLWTRLDCPLSHFAAPRRLLPPPANRHAFPADLDALILRS